LRASFALEHIAASKNSFLEWVAWEAVLALIAVLECWSRERALKAKNDQDEGRPAPYDASGRRLLSCALLHPHFVAMTDS
jgi:hypothetical protein